MPDTYRPHEHYSGAGALRTTEVCRCIIGTSHEDDGAGGQRTVPVHYGAGPHPDAARYDHDIAGVDERSVAVAPSADPADLRYAGALLGPRQADPVVWWRCRSTECTYGTSSEMLARDHSLAENHTLVGLTQEEFVAGPAEHDPVNHPTHYALAPGVEVIDLTEQLDFLRGNAVKYLARAGRKAGADELEDLRKAAWYANRAVAKLEAERA